MRNIKPLDVLVTVVGVSSALFACGYEGAGASSSPVTHTASDPEPASTSGNGEKEGCSGVESRWSGDLDVGAVEQSVLPCIEEVGGNLVVSSTMWTDLTALSQLRVVEGNLLIHQNQALESLDGLEKLRDALGKLDISGNPVLTDLTALGGVERVHVVVIGANESLADIASFAGDLQFVGPEPQAFVLERLPSLGHLDGLAALDGVSSVGGLRVQLLHLDALSDVEGLTGFSALGLELEIEMIGVPALVELGFAAGGELGSLEVSDAPNLTSVAGMGDLLRIRALSLWNGTALSSFTGFDALEVVDERLQIGGCEAGEGSPFDSLAGLGGLREVGLLSIIGNDGLSDLMGLSARPDLHIDAVQIRDNHSLSNEAALTYATAHSDDDIDVCGNAGGSSCIESACAPFPN
ncbi:MAG: hypothetical protein IAG13_21610 [Deltaproteobacteria bacterium]|nr:hypothetical protein [Nannocystaceae bacterium]